jgi:hypothetical protein
MTYFIAIYVTGFIRFYISLLLPGSSNAETYSRSIHIIILKYFLPSSEENSDSKQFQCVFVFYLNLSITER